MHTLQLPLDTTEYGLQSYIKMCAKQFRKCLSSQQVQKEVPRVWRDVEVVLFGNGNKLHFQKLMETEPSVGNPIPMG